MVSFPRRNSRYILFCGLAIVFLFATATVTAQSTTDEEKAADDKKASDEKKVSALEKAEMIAAAVKGLPECSVTKTNRSCRLTIDRRKPVTPPTIQMYSNESITVVVKNPNFFERYFLDYQTGQATLKPDVASSIVQGLLPSLAKAGEIVGYDAIQGTHKEDECDVPAITNSALPAAGDVGLVVPAVRKCVGQLARNSIPIYKKLEPFVAPDSSAAPGAVGPATPLTQQDLDDVKTFISTYVAIEFVLSARISTISNDTALKTTTDMVKRIADARAIVELTDLQKLADAIATDLLGYNQRIADLNKDVFEDGFLDCECFMKVATGEKCVSITSQLDDDRVYHSMVSRMITYSLNTLNLVSNSQETALDPTKKKLLASVAVNFADTTKHSAGSGFRWEASAGAFFSTLPIRSFSVAPVFTKGMITDKKINQNVLHPTVVPFAAANYRLTNDFRRLRWKSNIYWTGAVGINPNTVSADFATGLSLSWRALMVSGLAHFGHDVRLAQGLTVGQSLGASFNGSLPTQTFWTTSFALGVSVRIPSLVGR